MRTTDLNPVADNCKCATCVYQTEYTGELNFDNWYEKIFKASNFKKVNVDPFEKTTIIKNEQLHPDLNALLPEESHNKKGDWIIIVVFTPSEML